MTNTNIEPTYTNGSSGDGPGKAPIAERAKEAASETLTRAQDSLDAAVEQGSAELDRLSRQSTKFIQENPGVAVAGALGLGVLIGLALRNRYE